MSDASIVNLSNSNTSISDAWTVNLSNSNALSENAFNAHIQENCKGKLLSIEPHELQFPFELMEKITISLQLKNKTDCPVAFKVRTTKPNKYAANPPAGVLAPKSTKDVSFTMQAQEEAPQNMKCDDKCLLQSAVVSTGFLPKDITTELVIKWRNAN
uniref:vesicle-associated protein 1-2-like n=1 Tax=Erigeron canadensis TaxID=72917 RepID=UPI001CB92B72|nr:vesicle-associated protein 1-2-like [Erigeron canadensis]